MSATTGTNKTTNSYTTSFAGGLTMFVTIPMKVKQILWRGKAPKTSVLDLYSKTTMTMITDRH